MELGNGQRPILDWRRPFFFDVLDGAKNKLEQGIFAGECTFGFDIFSDLAMQSFDGVGGVNHFTDFGGILKIAG